MSADGDPEQQGRFEKDADSDKEVIEWPKPSGIFAANLYTRGIEYLEAFESLSQHKPDHKFPAYFLLTHSIELLLKSFLVAEGMQKKALERPPYGHKLPALLDECRKRRLSIDYKLSSLVNNLYIMNENYDFRYPTSYRLSVPHPPECIKIVWDNVENIRIAVSQANIDAVLTFSSETRHLRPKKIKWKD